MFSTHRNAIAICLSVLILMGVGLVMLTSTSVWIESDASRYSHITKQGIFMVVGLVGAWLVARSDYRVIRKKRWLLYLIFFGSLLLLALVYVPGIGQEIHGETRWIKLPGLGNFQPSEIGKLATIVAVSAWFAHYQAESRRFCRGFIWPSAIIAVPTLLILFERDMGTAAGLAAAGFCILFIAGTRLRYLVVSMLLAVGGLALVVQTSGNRVARIIAFMDLEAHKQGFGYQQWRGLLAFGNGGIEGVGIGNGAEKHGYLPFAHTDFIFPVIGEELGWVTLVVVLCFVCYTVFGLLVAMKANDVFGRLLAVGLTTIIVIPAMVNIGVTTAVLPNTGLPLPFVSYGGTNLVITLIAVGLLLSVHRGSKTEDTLDQLKVKKAKVDIRF